MKNLLKMIAALLLLGLLALSILPIFAEEDGGYIDEFEYETGYNRGYTGGKNGDGKLYAHGLDISVWQGASFNFEAAAAAGYTYIILRAGVTYEKDGVYVTEIDEHFETNYAGAKASGLDVGVYFYSMAKNPEEALKEADALIGYLEGKLLEYPVYMDFEAPAVRTYLESDPEKAREICKTFLDRIAEKGYLAGLYSSASWIDSGSYNGWMGDVADELGEKYELWVACYFNDATYYRMGEEYSERFGMYQYTSSKYISGYDGRLDANICFKDYPSIVKKYGFNGYTADDSIEVGVKEGLTEKCNFKNGTYAVSSSNSKTGVYKLPENDSESVGYISNGAVVEVIEACAVWGENWAKVTTEDGLCGWLKASNLKRYKKPAATDEKPTDEQSTDGADATDQGSDSSEGGCGAIVGGGATVICCIATGMLLKKRKEQ